MHRDDPNERPIEVWAGTECTVNRVGDRYFDQSVRNGHDERLDDLDRFAELGIRALRYPVLWERTAPRGPETADWRWPDERLGRLRALGVRPIVGLVHHGSGPRDTSLLDPAFPERLAAFAGAVARRYPWVEEWTPVNEPLTTARFSALYGHWYPHRRDDLAFARALLVQCRAVALAMQAIRKVNPAARLVQTDDLGKTFSTPTLAYQAELENERRWVTFDLLAGRLTPDRPMWGWLRKVGVAAAELDWFREHPCPPDIVGVNTYLSSERFLDERVDRYPSETPGTNGRHTYVDVLAARVLPEGAAGPEALLREAWDRFGLPLAITEAHNGCTREEQLRWLDEVWRDAAGARAAGADVRAVTAWSLLGAYDWHTLVTRDEGVYEPGVFDLRAPAPRPTAIARMVRDLATAGNHEHPVLAVPGWWRRPDRFIYRTTVPRETAPADPAAEAPEAANDVPRLLITGAGGRLGRALARACDERRIPYRLLDRRRASLADPFVVEAVLGADEPWAVVDAGGYNRPEDAGPAGASSLLHAAAAAALAAGCADRGRPLLTFSSDRVFAGDRVVPHVEGDPVAPLDAAGREAADAESRVLAAYPSALVVRTGPLLSAHGGSPVAAALALLAAGHAVAAPDDEVASPTSERDLAHAALDLLLDGERGIWHLANRGAATPHELIRRLAPLLGIEAGGLRPAPLPDGGLPCRRHRVLGSERGWLLPSLDDALALHAVELAAFLPGAGGGARPGERVAAAA